MKLVIKKNREVNRINKSSSIMLCIFMICVELGNKHSLLGIKWSYWGCILFAISLFWDYVNNRLEIFSKNHNIKKFQMFLLFWFTYGFLLSLMQVLIGNTSLEGIILLGLNMSLGFFLLVNINSKNRIFRYINTVSVMILICVVISLWELQTGKHIVAISYFEKYNRLPFGTFYNQNDYCTFLCLGIVIQILGIKLTNIKKNKIIYSLVILVGGYIALETESRASYICIALFFVLWLIFLLGNYLMRIYSSTVLIGVLMVVLIVVCIVGGLGSILYNFDAERMRIYQISIEWITKNFIFGYGPNKLAEITHVATHNLYLEIMGDYGIFVLFAFINYTLFNFLKTRTQVIPHANAFFSAYSLMLPILGCSSSNIQRVRLFWISITICYAVSNLNLKKESIGGIREDF